MRIADSRVATIDSTDATRSSPFAVTFVTPSRGWLLAGACDGAASTGCAIFATADGGKSWVEQYRTEFSLRALRFRDSSAGWVSGADCAGQGTARSCSGILLATTNGGRTWSLYRTGEAALSDLQIFEGSRGWALASNCPTGWPPCTREIRRTADGGRTWVTHPIGGLSPVGLSFVDPEHGWVAGCGASDGANGCRRPEVRATRDGGRTWDVQFEPTPTIDPFGASITFLDRANGWLLASSDHCTMGGCWGPLYRTVDGGRTWALLPWQMTGDLDGLPPGFPGTPTFVSSTVGWIPISAGAGPGVGGIARTVDGGQTWTRTGASAEWSIAAVSAVSQRAIWVVGSRRPRSGQFLLHSDDLGQTWTQLPLPQQLPLLGPVEAVDFLDRDHGWGVATLSDPGAVLATGDGGQSWSQVATIAGIELTKVSVADGQHLWVAGRTLSPPRSEWDVLRSSDGGRTWQVVHRSVGPISVLRFSTDRDGVLLAGENQFGSLPAVLLVSQDGGATWQGTGEISRSGSIAVDFLSPSLGWLVAAEKGETLHLLATRDGGKTWAVVGTLPWARDGPVTVIELVSPDAGWLGLGHTLLHTADGGQTWTQIILSPELQAEDVHFRDADFGWLLTGEGRLFATRDGGATWRRIATTAISQENGY